MKLDIKSVLIGVLLTINVMMLMGFQWSKSSEKEGKYTFMIVDEVVFIGDNTTGRVTAYGLKTPAKFSNFYDPS